MLLLWKRVVESSAPLQPLPEMGANQSYGQQWSLPDCQERAELQQCNLMLRNPWKQMSKKPHNLE